MDRRLEKPYGRAWFVVMILAPGNFIDPTCAKASPLLPILQDLVSSSNERITRKIREYNDALASGDSLKIAEQGYQLGKAYMGVGEQLVAQKYFIQALRIWESRRGWESMSKIYLRLAEYHIRLKHEREAFENARLAMHFAKLGGVRHNLMGANVVMGGAFALHSEMKGSNKAYGDSSDYHYNEALGLALALGNPVDIANLYSLYGPGLNEADRIKHVSNLKKANVIFTREKLVTEIITTRNRLADAYLNVHNTALAKQWLQQARYVMDTSRFHSFELRSNLLKSSATLCEQMANYKQALAYYKDYHDLAAKALTEDREGAVSRLSVEYETEKKAAMLASQKKELALQAENLKSQKWLTRLAMILSLSAIGFGGVFYWLYRKYRRTSNQNQLLVAEQNHRVKNNLQQITSLLSLQSNRMQDDSAGKQVLEESLLRIHAVSLVHQRLYDGNQPVQVDLAEYIPRLAASVFKIFGMESFQPQYLVEKIWLHADQAASFGLILNEMMTNACKYALPHQQEPSLMISCVQQGESIVFEMKDNGPGFSYESVKKGFGLQLIAVLAGRLKAELSASKEGNHFTLVFEP
ncbi:hypothetical protein DYBT9275_04888 [Dyadobacter sp. CECT 9275]|uniref:histidine kinase n=1 Tax=Dyadobacter helix TaxID=2822344 RepID=A0A916N7Z2_9BACT|nr:histidine kinase dimerization/phosphoacceptor domain -containing protein [Dyadobacter sp. CECT 9275]CAG5011133.1 hypothetical protein DYBT9275_04888 [Dyadobacter sp. CECT 9275]